MVECGMEKLLYNVKLSCIHVSKYEHRVFERASMNDVYLFKQV